jgi:hypothetical protein
MATVLIALIGGMLGAAITQYLKVPRQTRECWSSWAPDLKYRGQTMALIAGAIGGLTGAATAAIARAVQGHVSTPAAGVTIASGIVTVLLLNKTPAKLVGDTVTSPLNLLSGWILWLRISADRRTEEAVTSYVISLDLKDTAKLASRVHRLALGGNRYESQAELISSHEELLRLTSLVVSTEVVLANEAYGQLQAFAIRRVLDNHTTRSECE